MKEKKLFPAAPVAAEPIWRIPNDAKPTLSHGLARPVVDILCRARRQPWVYQPNARYRRDLWGVSFGYRRACGRGEAGLGSCEQPLALNLVPGVNAVTGTTRGAASDVDAVTCPGSSYATTVTGADVIYKVVVPALARVRASTVSGFGSMMLYLASEPCASAGPMACSGYYSSPWLETTFALAAGNYYLYVDQRITTSGDPIPGDFTVTVELLAP